MVSTAASMRLNVLDGARTTPIKPKAGKQAPVAAPKEDLSVSSVALSYLKEASGVKNLVFKPVALAAEWALIADPSNVPCKNMHRLAKDAKNLSELSALPGKGVEVGQKVSQFVAAPSFTSFGGIIHKISDFFIPFSDAFKTIADKVSPLSQRAASVLSVTSAGALVTAMTFGTVEEIGKANEANAKAAKDKSKSAKVAAEAQEVNSFFAVIRNTSFQSLGAITLAAAVTPFAMGWYMTALATNGLVFSILGHFHKKMVLDPAAAKV